MRSVDGAMAEADLQGLSAGEAREEHEAAAAIRVPRAGHNFFMPIVNWITYGWTGTGA